MKKAEEKIEETPEEKKKRLELKAENDRKDFLKGIKYSFDENSYSFEFEDEEYKFKGYPSVTEKAQIRGVLNMIAPGVSDSEEFIFGSKDFFLMTLSKGIAYSTFLTLSPKHFNPDTFFKGENGEIRCSSFGLSIIMSELEFKRIKKKQS